MQPIDPTAVPRTAAAESLPPNPIQRRDALRAWPPDGDITTLKNTLNTAIRHLGAVLTQVPTRSNRRVVEARKFLAQFHAPKNFTPADGSED